MLAPRSTSLRFKSPRRTVAAATASIAVAALAGWLVAAPGTANAGTLTGTLYRSTDTQVVRWVNANPNDYRTPAIRDRIASQPQAVWFTRYNPTEIQSQVAAYVGAANAANQIPQMVVYNIPKRDCGQYSSGGAPDHASYQGWIRNFAAGLGNRVAIIMLESDALALQDCLSASERTERNNSISTAIGTIKAANANARVYLDAGHSAWHPAAESAARLRAAGVSSADGFFTNVANFRTTSDEVAYGRNILAALNDSRLHQVIDTSRNGNGPKGEEWCDPTGRRIGPSPTTNTGEASVDAFVWVKPPGEADGCAATAGTFMPDYAYEMAGSGTVSASPTVSPASPSPASPSPSPSRPASLSPSVSTPPGACAVTYKVDAQWGNGFTGNVTVANRGTSAITGWTLTFTFPGDQRITNGWNATYSQSGTAVSVRDAGHNATIPAGGSQSFGFQGTYSGTNAAPTAFTLNGRAC